MTQCEMEDEARSQFTFYRSFFEAVFKIKSKAARAEAYDAICKYALTGIEPDAETTVSAAMCAFQSVKPLIDTERRQSAEGRRCVEYKMWRRNVFERDDYTCQHCGARGVKLNAHHIKPYSIYFDLRYSVPNGITLCVPCHKIEHGGRGNGD